MADVQCLWFVIGCTALVVPEGPGMLPIPDDLAVPTGVAVKVVCCCSTCNISGT